MNLQCPTETVLLCNSKEWSFELEKKKNIDSLEKIFSYKLDNYCQKHQEINIFQL